jgi:hypothetical protein
MSDANELVRLLEHMQRAPPSPESGGAKLYPTGPGSASIDGTPQYLRTVEQRPIELDRALAIARKLAQTGT